MAALQISSSICSSLDRLCTTSLVYHETVPFRFKSTCGRLLRKNAVGVRASGAEQQNENDMQTRRQVLGGVGVLVASLAFDQSALAAKAPKGYAAVLDNADGYQFFYPFGWQEVAVKGQDVAFKDVIEPLESVSVSIIKTDKGSLQDLGSPDQVAKALVERVLASPTQKTQLIEAKERSTDGKTYYTFEFIAKAPNYTRHALGTVSIKDGKFYTLTTGANERRWEKMADKLKIAENTEHQKRIGELEKDVKSSGQQNIQQRIHHHARIKEENNTLRLQNEDLSVKLRRSDILFARVNDELARYRIADGKTPFLNIDEEQCLRSKLQEADESNVQMAQKFVSLCTSILQVAGISQHGKEMDQSLASEALKQIEDRLQSMEQELSDMKLKTRIAGEKRRLSKLRAVHSSPMKPSNCINPQR